MTERVGELVAEAFKNAKTNGYEFEEWTHYEIACDMMSYDAYLEDVPFETILYHVKMQRS